ncbi:MAG: beta-ketoacyl-ACP synthase 3 [Clostridiales bacterium]|nr:beta-ketoacyl-ACP synthase 3 [Clostridiales bacterium]
MLAPVTIAGVAKCVPERVVTNFDLESIVETSDEWIAKRTGIRSRHVVIGETGVGMACQAAGDALAMSGVRVEDVGVIVACTITGEDLTPSLAGSVQKALGIPVCAALDVSAGCTGFIYALVTAASLMDTLQKDAAIVVASEVMTKYLDWTDRSTCVLFGDGAGALVLRRSETAHLLCPILSATPDTDDVITVRKEARTTPFTGPAEEIGSFIRMKGADVFTYAVGVMEQTLLQLSGACPDHPYTKVVPHQANEKIIDFVVRTMGLSREQFFVNISNYANTSSASIPIALSDAWESGWLRAGDRVALVGFGSGLTSGGAMIDWTLPNKKEN